MTTQHIQAIGNFLQYYHSDLFYIKNFQDYKNSKISSEEYVKKNTGTFYSFLTEFRVARNFTKGCADKLLKETLIWISSHNADNVDLFAELLSKSDLTRGNITTSLASKILFLNNPWKILPMDTLTRKALHQMDNKYSTYLINLEKYRNNYKSTIDKCLSHTNELAKVAEQDFVGKIINLHILRENRIIDKLLWSTR